MVIKHKISCHKSTTERHKQQTAHESLLRKRYTTACNFCKRDGLKISHLIKMPEGSLRLIFR